MLWQPLTKYISWANNHIEIELLVTFTQELLLVLLWNNFLTIFRFGWQTILRERRLLITSPLWFIDKTWTLEKTILIFIQTGIYWSGYSFIGPWMQVYHFSDFHLYSHITWIIQTHFKVKWYFKFFAGFNKKYFDHASSQPASNTHRGSLNA